MNILKCSHFHLFFEMDSIKLPIPENSLKQVLSSVETESFRTDPETTSKVDTDAQDLHDMLQI